MQFVSILMNTEGYSKSYIIKPLHNPISLQETDFITTLEELETFF